MKKKNDIWNQIKASLGSTISPSESKVWFSNTFLTKLDAETAVIEVPNKFIATWIQDNYVKKIQSYLRRRLNLRPEIRFAYRSPSPIHDHTQQEMASNTGTLPGSPPNPSMTFSGYSKSSSNRFACASALQVAEKPGNKYNPYYVFSKLSLGKTHLINAIGNQIILKDPIAKVRYQSAKSFASDFTAAFKSGQASDLRENYKNLDALIMDDVHLILENIKIQQEVAFILDMFLQSGQQVVLAGQEAPAHMDNLFPRLRSRMEWGLVVEIKVPDQTCKMKIIKKKAKKENLNLPEDVAFFMSNATNDLKALIKYLDDLRTYSSLYRREVDMSAVNSVLNNRPLKRASVKDIQKFTAEFFNISVSELLSKNKTRAFSYPRQMAMYLTRKVTDLSYTEIGKAFGDRDHSTIIYAVRRIQGQKERSASVLEDIKKLQSFLS